MVEYNKVENLVENLVEYLVDYLDKNLEYILENNKNIESCIDITNNRFANKLYFSSSSSLNQRTIKIYSLTMLILLIFL